MKTKNRQSLTRAIGEKNARLLRAAPALLRAAKLVYADLDARIETAPATAVPVFRGLAELHTAICKMQGTETPCHEPKINRDRQGQDEQPAGISSSAAAGGAASGAGAERRGSAAVQDMRLSAPGDMRSGSEGTVKHA